jgi:hypothetical protein
VSARPVTESDRYVPKATDCVSEQDCAAAEYCIGLNHEFLRSLCGQEKLENKRKSLFMGSM